MHFQRKYDLNNEVHRNEIKFDELQLGKCYSLDVIVK